jgi:DNA-binding response OmpR family regulator
MDSRPYIVADRRGLNFFLKNFFRGPKGTVMIASLVADLPAPPSEAAPLRDTILLVDDDDLVASLVARLLERGRWRVIRAIDGAGAEYAVSQHGPAIALALVDGRLPDTEGAPLCERLRAVVPGLPVLLVSGRECSSLACALAAGGPAAYLAKPFMPLDVLRQVQSLIGRAA